MDRFVRLRWSCCTLERRALEAEGVACHHLATTEKMKTSMNRCRSHNLTHFPNVLGDQGFETNANDHSHPADGFMDIHNFFTLVQYTNRSIKRSTLIWFVFLLICVPLVALGMTPREPTPEVYTSHRGRFIVRIEPGKYVKNPTTSSHTTARVFEFNSHAHAYEPRATFKLENEILPRNVLITEDGSRIVAVDDWFNQDYKKPVIVVYDASGIVLKRFRINDLLSLEEADEIKPPKGKLYWLPWTIDVNLKLNSNEIFIMRDRIAMGPGKKHDNLFIDLKTFKISKEKLE